MKKIAAMCFIFGLFAGASACPAQADVVQAGLANMLLLKVDHLSARSHWIVNVVAGSADGAYKARAVAVAPFVPQLGQETSNVSYVQALKARTGELEFDASQVPGKNIGIEITVPLGIRVTILVNGQLEYASTVSSLTSIADGKVGEGPVLFARSMFFLAHPDQLDGEYGEDMQPGSSDEVGSAGLRRHLVAWTAPSGHMFVASPAMKTGDKAKPLNIVGLHIEIDNSGRVVAANVSSHSSRNDPFVMASIETVNNARFTPFKTGRVRGDVTFALWSDGTVTTSLDRTIPTAKPAEAN